MDTSLLVALLAVVAAAATLLAQAVPWALQGGRDVWDERARRRGTHARIWSPDERAEFHATQPRRS